MATICKRRGLRVSITMLHQHYIHITHFCSGIISKNIHLLQSTIPMSSIVKVGSFDTTKVFIKCRIHNKNLQIALLVCLQFNSQNENIKFQHKDNNKVKDPQGAIC